MDQNAVQAANPQAGQAVNPQAAQPVNSPAIQPLNPPINNAVNNDHQQHNNNNCPRGRRTHDGDRGRLDRQRDIRDDLHELCQNCNVRVDLNKRHNERDEYELCRCTEYDLDYGAPIPNRDVVHADRRHQEDEMRRRADYDRAYDAPEGPHDPPRRDYNYEDVYNPPRREYDYEDDYYPTRRNYGGRGRVNPD